MARCSCHYEVGGDTIRRDTNPKCEVHNPQATKENNVN